MFVCDSPKVYSDVIQPHGSVWETIYPCSHSRKDVPVSGFMQKLIRPSSEATDHL